MNDEQPYAHEKSSEQGEDDAVIMELARVYRDRDEALLLAEKAGCPRERIPEFKTSELFWTKMADQARAGMLHGGIRPIVEQALMAHPANAIFSGAGLRYRSRPARGEVRPPTDGTRFTGRSHGPWAWSSNFVVRDAFRILLGAVLGGTLMLWWHENEAPAVHPRDGTGDIERCLHTVSATSDSERSDKMSETGPKTFELGNRAKDITQCLRSFSVLSDTVEEVDKTKEDCQRTVERHKNDCKDVVDALRGI